MVPMPPTAALAGEQEGAVLEKDRLAWIVDPGLRRLAEEFLRRATVGRDRQYVEPCLGTILHVEQQALAVGCPAGSRQDRAIGRTGAEVHEFRLIAVRGQQAELHERVRVAGLRVRGLLQSLMYRQMIDDC